VTPGADRLSHQLVTTFLAPRILPLAASQASNRRLYESSDFMYRRLVAGEVMHDRGADGARRAKAWLEATTRVNVHWVTPDQVAVPKLTFTWANGAPFSFDLGGTLMDGHLHGQMFLAECKHYQRPHDQGSKYVEYLAKCYRARQCSPERCDNFMWITWAPFSVEKWNVLLDHTEVKKAVLRHYVKALGVEDIRQAATALDVALCADVADRLWLIVLSRKQEALVVSPEHRAEIQKYRILQNTQ
jgi:hypothetical protein